MDGIKLDRWKKNFLKAVNELRGDNLFKFVQFDKCCKLIINESDSLALEFEKDTPLAIQAKMNSLLEQTMPEDSV